MTLRRLPIRRERKPLTTAEPVTAIDLRKVKGNDFSQTDLRAA